MVRYWLEQTVVLLAAVSLSRQPGQIVPGPWAARRHARVWSVLMQGSGWNHSCPEFLQFSGPTCPKSKSGNRFRRVWEGSLHAQVGKGLWPISIIISEFLHFSSCPSRISIWIKRVSGNAYHVVIIPLAPYTARPCTRPHTREGTGKKLTSCWGFVCQTKPPNSKL